MVKGDVSIVEFFSDVQNDASNIVWAHAVNTKEKLDQALDNVKLHMLEADIVFINDVAVMGHPPCTESDITFEKWFETLRSSKSKKGMKLDFKSIDAVKPVLNILREKEFEVDFPVWLNADVLPGPNAENEQTVDIEKFLQTVNNIFPQCTLSLGWTTKCLKGAIDKAYSWTMVKQMHTYLVNSACKQPLTFAVCAYIMKPCSVSKLKWLTDVTGGSLTVWASSPNTEPSLSDMLYIRHIFDKDRIFYDLKPETFWKTFAQKKNNPLSSILESSEEVDGNVDILKVLENQKPGVKEQWENMLDHDDKSVYFGSQSLLMGVDGVILSKKQFTVSDSRLVDIVGTVNFPNLSHSDSVIVGVEILLRLHDKSSLGETGEICCYLGLDGTIRITIKNSSGDVVEESHLPSKPSNLFFKITDSQYSVSMSAYPSSSISVLDTVENGRCVTSSTETLQRMEGHLAIRTVFDNNLEDTFVAFEDLEILQG